MVICGECGTRNTPGTPFCISCGAFLEWEGEPAEPATASTVSTAPAVSTPGGPTGSVLTHPSADPTTPADRAAPADRQPPADHSSPADLVAPVEPATAAEPSSPSTESSGPPEQRPSASNPRLVRPDEQRQHYHPVTREEADATGPADARCPHCGVGNAATRRFCRSCGAALAVQPAAVRRPWWRRLLDRLTRRRAHELGARRKLRGPRGWLRVVAIMSVLLAAAVAAVTVLPTRGIVDRMVTATKDRLSDHVPVTPSEVTALTAARNAPASHISDGSSNKYWAPSGKPVGSWVQARLARPVRLLDVAIYSGISTDKKLFLTQGRPRDVTVTVTDKAGVKTDTAIVVQDEPGQQTFHITVSDAVVVRFTIRSTYGMPPARRCAIGEIGLFIRG